MESLQKYKAVAFMLVSFVLVELKDEKEGVSVCVCVCMYIHKYIYAGK